MIFCSVVLRHLALSTIPHVAGAIERGFQIHCSALLKYSFSSVLSRETLECKVPLSFSSMTKFSSKPCKPSSDAYLLTITDEEIKCTEHDPQLLLRQEEDREYHHKQKQKEEWQGERFHLLKSRGQHLLTNPRVLDSIIRKANVLPTDTVLEIGPGTGNLTVRLLECARKVIAVEIDERMVATLRSRVATLDLEDKLVVMAGNVLKMELPHFDICVSNIPYGISSPLIAKIFLRSYKTCFRSATLLIQKEFARRLLAKPGESDFNRLAVNVRLVASTDFLMNVSKKDFVPCPKVDSSLVQIQPKLNIPDINLDEWLGFTRTCFSKRNKTLYAIFKQKKKIIDLYEKSLSNSINCKTPEFEDQVSDCNLDGNNESYDGDGDGDVGISSSEFGGQNSTEVIRFREKILRILKDGGFGEKRPSKLSNEEFLCLLQLFNKEGVFFR